LEGKVVITNTSVAIVSDCDWGENYNILKDIDRDMFASLVNNKITYFTLLDFRQQIPVSTIFLAYKRSRMNMYQLQ